MRPTFAPGPALTSHQCGLQPRQARLKPQFASLYPGVVAGEWIPAWVLAEQLMNTAEQRGVAAGARVCDPAHCEFRGGGQRTAEFRNLRTRMADQE